MIGALSTTQEVAIYKIGMAAATLVGKLADPALVSILPRLSRLWAAGKIPEVRRLVQQSTMLAAPILAIATLGVVLLRGPIVRLLGGGGASAANQVVVYASLAMAVAALVYWATPLLWAAGKASVVSRAFVAGAVIQMALLPALVPAIGARGAAIAFLVTQLAISAQVTWHAVRVLRISEVSGSEATWEARLVKTEAVE